MDVSSKIETYKAALRFKYGSDIAGLKKLCRDLIDGAASDDVTITSHTFEGGGASGAIQLEPIARLNAALSVIAELDEESAALLAAPGRGRFADFSGMMTTP